MNWRKWLTTIIATSLAYLPFGIVLLFYSTFRNKLIDNTSVARESFLWTIDSSLNADLLIFSVIILVAYYLVKDKLSQAFINNTLKWLFILTIIYGYEKWITEDWTFTHSQSLTWLFYLDIIFILVVLFGSKAVFNLIISKRKPKYETTYFKEDHPITGKENKDEDEDELEYQDYAKEIFEKLSQGNFKKSFAVGVCGPWGSGKTSFINLLKKEFQKSDDNIWVEFSPWNAEGDIQDEFFNVVEQSVYKKSENLARLIHSYSSSLNEFVDNGFWKKLNSKFESNLTGRTKNDQIESIGNQLIRSKKKLIIIIDDIDRLVQEEILEILRIIRNTGDFKNTIYLVAYDKEYLISVLKQKFPSGRTEYSDKVFQLEIILPQIEENLIIEKLVALIKSKEKRLEPVLSEILSYKGGWYKEEIIRHLKTPRDIIKVANSFSLNFQQLPEDLNIKDLLFIEILKLRDTQLYYNIYKRKNEILGYFNENENAKKEIYFQLKDDSSKFVEKYSSSLDQGQLNDLSELLLILLHNSNYSIEKNTYKKSICIPSQFATYFSLNLSKEKIPNAEIAKLRGLKYHEMVSEAMKLTRDRKRGTDFVQKLYSIDSFDSTDDFKSILRLKLLFAHNMPNQTGSIISDIRNVLNSKVFFENDEAVTEFIYEELNSTQFDRNERLKLAYLIVHHDNLKKLLNEGQFNAIQIKAVDEQFAEGKRTEPMLGFRLGLLFVEKEKCDFTYPKLPQGTKKAMTIQTAQHLKSKLIEWDLKSFLELLIVEADPNDPSRFKLAYVEQFYSSTDELVHDETLKIHGKEKELKEFKDFVKKWGGITNGISYRFVSLDPSRMKL